MTCPSWRSCSSFSSSSEKPVPILEMVWKVSLSSSHTASKKAP